MLLFCKKDDATGTMLGVAKMGDCVGVECEFPPHVMEMILAKRGVRRRETMAVYALLYEMLGDRTLVIGHLSNGRPVLPGYNISVSHTNGYVAVVVSRRLQVSVDIEYVGDRVCRIADRFMSKREFASLNVALSQIDETSAAIDYKVMGMLLHWCAKETMYKYFSDERLTFMNMIVTECTPSHNVGEMKCKNLLTGQSLPIGYIYNSEYVLTYIM